MNFTAVEIKNISYRRFVFRLSLCFYDALAFIFLEIFCW